MFRLLRKPDPPDLAETLTAARAESIERLRDRWMIGTWATVSTAATRFALLLLAIRFTGTPDSVISWPEIFLVYAIVQGLTVLPITAGDAGVSEVAYIGLLSAAAGPGVRQPDHRRCPDLPDPHLGHDHPHRTDDPGRSGSG